MSVKVDVFWIETLRHWQRLAYYKICPFLYMTGLYCFIVQAPGSCCIKNNNQIKKIKWTFKYFFFNICSIKNVNTQANVKIGLWDIFLKSWILRPIYMWVRFRIRLAHLPKYKNNYILKNGLSYCEIALSNRTCKLAFSNFEKSTNTQHVKLFWGLSSFDNFAFLS